GVLLRNHFESLYEKINPLMPRDLADEEKIPLRREFLADFGIPEWALVYFDDKRNDKIALAPDSRQLLRNCLKSKLGVVNKISHEREPQRKQPVCRAQIVKMLDHSAPSKPA